MGVGGGGRELGDSWGIVTGMTQPAKISIAQSGIKPQIFHSRGRHLNHEANEIGVGGGGGGLEN